MTTKKKSDKPKAVCLPLDRLSIQVGFINVTLSGYLFKLIVYYCIGETDMIVKLKADLADLHPNDYNMVLMAFEENKAIIDENLAKYKDICEKRRQAVLKREEYKREQKLSNDSNKLSHDNKCLDMIVNTDTDTNTNTDTDTNTDTNSSSLHSEENNSLSPNGEESGREWREVFSFISDKCKENLALLEPLTDAQAKWIFGSCSRRAWMKILSDLDDMPNLRQKHRKQFKAYENIYNFRKQNGSLETILAH